MKKLVFASIFAVALSATGYFVWDSYLSPKAKALQRIRNSLFDPASAVFEGVRHSNRTGATCGDVNAKNRLGGYTGFTGFIIEKDGTVVLAPTSDTEFGSDESRIKALKERLAFLEKAEKVCDLGSNNPSSKPASEEARP